MKARWARRLPPSVLCLAVVYGLLTGCVARAQSPTSTAANDAGAGAAFQALDLALTAHRALRGDGVVVACTITRAVRDSTWVPRPTWPELYGPRTVRSLCQGAIGAASGRAWVDVERVAMLPAAERPSGTAQAAWVRLQVRAVAGAAIPRWWEEYLVGELQLADGSRRWELLQFRRAGSEARSVAPPSP